mgnify:CR=1 FL=1
MKRSIILILLFSTLSLSARVVTKEGDYTTDKALWGKTIALWHSHGLYFNEKEQSWMWQRAPVMTSVEDKLTMSYVLQYLLPMLENAGAEVMMPTERDISPFEVVNVNGEFVKTTKKNHKQMITQLKASGEHWVSIMYNKTEEPVSDVNVYVYDAVGVTHYVVDQTRGYGTWIYLGKHFFSGKAVVIVSSESSEHGYVTNPNIRIGGGFGQSGELRIWECASEWLKYAGAPNSISTMLEGQNNYRDDITCRPHWVNWLAGGTSVSPRTEGLRIPVDVTLALHTDAGTSLDKTVGTLGIYSSTGYNGKDIKSKKFPNGRRRTVSKQLAQYVHGQIVKDIRSSFEPKWRDRGLKDARYYEAIYEFVPTTLIELLSHQNYNDMRYGLDPRFKFVACRAIYKGLLRYLNGNDAIVQPLPINSFSATLKPNSDTVRLSWLPTTDSLEISAMPTSYIVYRRLGKGGWDYGRVVESTNYEMVVPRDTVVSFKVVAVNDGGLSFPSEVLSVFSRTDAQGEVLVVNAYDRICGSDGFNAYPYIGFAEWSDHGVGYIESLDYLGRQVDFDFRNQWVTDDIAGWGHSSTEHQFEIIEGNTFDYTSVVGREVCNDSLYSWSSISRDAFIKDTTLCDFQIVAVNFGKQRTTRIFTDEVAFKALPAKLALALNRTLYNGSNLYLTGTNFVGDVCTDSAYTDVEREFFGNLTGTEWRGRLYEESCDMLRAVGESTENIEFFNKTGKGSKGVAVATRKRHRNGCTVTVKTK